MPLGIQTLANWACFRFYFLSHRRNFLTRSELLTAWSGKRNLSLSQSLARSLRVRQNAAENKTKRRTPVSLLLLKELCPLHLCRMRWPGGRILDCLGPVLNRISTAMTVWMALGKCAKLTWIGENGAGGSRCRHCREVPSQQWAVRTEEGCDFGRSWLKGPCDGCFKGLVFVLTLWCSVFSALQSSLFVWT